MRKKLLAGSVIVSVLILLVPVCSAVEWKNVQTELNQHGMQDPSLQALFKDDGKDPKPTCIIAFLTFLILLLKFVRAIRQNFKISQILLGLIILFILTHFYE
jgi:hypothetical protein